jgi:hypothetical protein
MSKTPAGPFGASRGKLGDIDTLRSRTLHGKRTAARKTCRPTKPPSAAQLLARERMRTVQAVRKLIQLAILTPPMATGASGLTAYYRALQWLLRNVRQTTLTSHTWASPFSVYASGALSFPITFCVNDGLTQVEIAWTTGLSAPNDKATDLFYGVCFRRTAAIELSTDISFHLGTRQRSQIFADFTPLTSGKSWCVIGYFKGTRADGTTIYSQIQGRCT